MEGAEHLWTLQGLLNTFVPPFPFTYFPPLSKVMISPVRNSLPGSFFPLLPALFGFFVPPSCFSPGESQP